MEKFEIHITGDSNIIGALQKRNLKSLHAEMRNPHDITIGVEYMSSFVKEFKDYEACKLWVTSFVNILKDWDNINIIRTKIECPYSYKHYRDQSIYAEAHFPKTRLTQHFPFVYNVNSDKYVCTDRVHNKSDYNEFSNIWIGFLGAEVELCLFDDNIAHDEVWINSFI